MSHLIWSFIPLSMNNHGALREQKCPVISKDEDFRQQCFVNKTLPKIT